MGSNKARKESSALKIDTGLRSPGVTKRGSGLALSTGSSSFVCHEPSWLFSLEL